MQLHNQKVDADVTETLQDQLVATFCMCLEKELLEITEKRTCSSNLINILYSTKLFPISLSQFLEIPLNVFFASAQCNLLFAN